MIVSVVTSVERAGHLSIYVCPFKITLPFTHWTRMSQPGHFPLIFSGPYRCRDTQKRQPGKQHSSTSTWTRTRTPRLTGFERLSAGLLGQDFYSTSIDTCFIHLQSSDNLVLANKGPAEVNSSGRLFEAIRQPR